MAVRRITLHDLAKHLGVSTATVSLALRGSQLVSLATREAVVKAARDLGYVYNRSAAGLRTTRSNAIGLGFHDILNPFFTELLSAIEETTLEAGYTVLLGTYQEDPVRMKQIVSTLVEHQPDGLILCPASHATIDHFSAARQSGVSIVQVSREIEGSGIDFVGADDALGTEIAFRHLYECGHRRIGYIGGSEAVSTGRTRRDTYRRLMAESGIGHDPALITEGKGSRENGLKGIIQLLALSEPPTAVLCLNDLTAFGVLMGLARLGLTAGKDISVIGCDDVQESAQWAPALTTIRNHNDQMGKKAAELLFRRIADPQRPMERILLTPTLVERETVSSV
jgi:LacI family transcriptional regulator